MILEWFASVAMEILVVNVEIRGMGFAPISGVYHGNYIDYPSLYIFFGCEYEIMDLIRCMMLGSEFGHMGRLKVA